ncbi:MAG: IS200/IS605 family transposase [Patescibacteria group bacterium]
MSNRRLYSLNHSTYDCQYHIVWITKWRGKVLTDKYIKSELKSMFRRIADWKGLTILSWHVGDEHVHIILTIPPKYSVAYVIQVLKGKTSSWIKKKTKKLPKGSLWVRGYFVSTIGLDEAMVRNYVDTQHVNHQEMPKLPI